MMHSIKIILTIFITAILSLTSTALAENIDPYDSNSQFAYGENIGWLNFEPNVIGDSNSYGVTVTNNWLRGYIWAENIGWINLDPNDFDPDTGIRNDSAGNLSGLAWGENVGWLNFDPNVAADSNDYGVSIDIDGNFDGWAWGENIGWIHFQSTQPVAYKVRVCRLSWDDLANFVDDWLDSGPSLAADLSGNDKVNFADYSIFTSYWLNYCPDGWLLK